MRLTRIFKAFFNSEKIGGFILLGCTILSLIIANSASGHSYIHFWHKELNLSFDGIDLDYSIEQWINDGLMTIFFLLVGLEIERELYVGELHKIRNAFLPIAAAIGGMLLPAFIHYLINSNTATQPGFGIPMATDIAFAIGMLSILGSRIPPGLKVFLTALAIIDDLGAIMVIAIFYNKGISLLYLGIAMGIFTVLLVLNRLKVYKLVVYLIPGIIMWYCMMKSGVHATISGVMLAFAIPFTKDDDTNPSYHLQLFLHKPVSFIILPLFALANTGLFLHQGWEQQMLQKNNLGIMLGLLIGKPLGIFLFSWLLVRAKWSSLPYGVTWKLLLGAGMLAGIGFTMSIFISNLAFQDAELIRFSKIAVLTGSLFSCVLGLVMLYYSSRPLVKANDYK